VKYAWIDTQRPHYPLWALCEALQVSPSGYRAWLKGGTPNRVRLTDEQALAQIKSLHAEVKGAYGSRRIYLKLRDRQLRIGRRRVERLMRLHGIRSRHHRRFKVTTDSAYRLPVAPNLLARQFKPTAPNRVGMSDITFIATQEGWLYLAVVIDLFNRQILG